MMLHLPLSGSGKGDSMAVLLIATPLLLVAIEVVMAVEVIGMLEALMA